ncbi:MAG TPA: tRNA 2-thiouridine(34) synthase MnmA [Candidatus Acidoferrales bacterium]|nr:tRNA 2-thiouridine(34) synthase MnmA [Candidatus Acidoferrales bacterium]
MTERPLVIVGMSGGVDSSVAALRLLEAGYRVEGLFMFNWDDPDGDCDAARDYQDARSVCEELGIALHRVRFAAEYREQVFQHFLHEYAAGRTPNPDILCNREIKFRHFLRHARRLGADFIATGHYARIVQGAEGAQLLTAVDSDKDQTYFLHAIDPEALSCTLFPVGELTKSEVRRIAEEAGFRTARKKDSTGICFIGERDFNAFLSRYLPARPGLMVDCAGRELGVHQGLMFYTLGQRKGLGLGGAREGSGAPWYVLDKDLAGNRLIVGQDHDHPRLLSRTLWTEPPHWLSGDPTEASRDDLRAKVRYRQSAQSCRVTRQGEGLRVDFETPQWAVTPGQSIVFYRQDQCLGGAVIRARLTIDRPATDMGSFA